MLIFLAAFPLVYNACGSAPSIEGIDVESSGDTEMGGSGGGNPMVPNFMAPFTPPRTYVGCLAAIKTRSEGGAESIINLSSRLVQINHTGTDLGSVPIPRGTYDSVSLVFQASYRCSPSLPADTSFVVNNSTKTFSLSEIVELRFSGFYSTPDPEGRTLLYDMSDIADALESAQSVQQVEQVFSNINGGFGPGP